MCGASSAFAHRHHRSPLALPRNQSHRTTYLVSSTSSPFSSSQVVCHELLLTAVLPGVFKQSNRFILNPAQCLKKDVRGRFQRDYQASPVLYKIEIGATANTKRKPQTTLTKATIRRGCSGGADGLVLRWARGGYS